MRERLIRFTTIVHRDKAYNVGKGLVEKLKELIRRQTIKFDPGLDRSPSASESSARSARMCLATVLCAGDISRRRNCFRRPRQKPHEGDGSGVEVPGGLQRLLSLKSVSPLLAQVQAARGGGKLKA